MEDQNLTKISFCTVCMNRLHHLKQTLPKNIEDNSDYGNLEFILLDYNSTDGLEEFVKIRLMKHLNSGKLIYYKTISPQYFNRSHSRNLAFKLASGNIICNIDADNFTGKRFAAYVNSELQKKNNGFLTAIGLAHAKQDVLGRICVMKSDFHRLTGYDERMLWYGFEDHDFAARLELNGTEKIFLAEPYLNAITHEQTERLSNENLLSNVSEVYVNYLTPASSDFLFLFNDGSFHRGIMVDNDAFNYTGSLSELKKSQLDYDYSIYDDIWKKGTWELHNGNLELKLDGFPTETFVFSSEKNCFTRETSGNSSHFYRLKDADLVQHLLMFFCSVSNRIIMTENILNERIAPNTNGFGSDSVFRNFDYANPLNV